MQRIIYRVDAMDCPCKERLIRMKLGDMSGIKAMHFDLQTRQVTIDHETETALITEALQSLRLGSHLQSSIEIEEIVHPSQQEGKACSCHCSCGEETSNTQERKTLWWVLIINFVCFLLEGITGYIGGSMGLLADGMDMLADSFVYALALLAVGASIRHQKRVAGLAGGIQLLLALWGIYEVMLRFINFRGVPSMGLMVGISLIALVGNAASLLLLNRNQSQAAHIQASRIFTSTDVIVNIGVIISALLVAITHAPYPDLIVGTIIFLLVLRSSWRIFLLAR